MPRDSVSGRDQLCMAETVMFASWTVMTGGALTWKSVEIGYLLNMKFFRTKFGQKLPLDPKLTFPKYFGDLRSGKQVPRPFSESGVLAGRKAVYHL